MKNALIVYHNADFDGLCSAAIAAKYCTEVKNAKIDLYGMDYGDTFDKSRIIDKDAIIILDFSFQMEQMYDIMSLLIENNSFIEKIGRFNGLIFKEVEFIWIDHHKSAIENETEFIVSGGIKFDGLRDVKFAACELAWKYFYTDNYMPTVVRLLGRYDVWDHSESHIETFQLGISTKFDEYNLTNENSIKNWNILLNETVDALDLCSELIKAGEAIEKYIDAKNKRDFSYVFKTEFEGFKTLVINIPRFNSKFFKNYNDINTFDLMLGFVISDGWIYVSLRSDNQNVDCSEIAKKYGGGGHKGAAGFRTKNLFNITVI